MGRQTITLTVLGEPTLIDVEQIVLYWGAATGGTVITLADPRRADGDASIPRTIFAYEPEERVRELIEQARGD